MLSNVCVKCGKKKVFIGTVILGVYLPFPNRHDHGGDTRVPTTRHIANGGTTGSAVSLSGYGTLLFYFIYFFL